MIAAITGVAKLPLLACLLLLLPPLPVPALPGQGCGRRCALRMPGLHIVHDIYSTLYIQSETGPGPGPAHLNVSLLLRFDFAAGKAKVKMLLGVFSSLLFSLSLHFSLMIYSARFFRVIFLGR